MKVLNTFFILLITFTNVLSQNPFERRTSISDVIVEGEIIEKQSYWNADKSRIFTSNKIEVTKFFKGLHSSETIEFLTFGGAVENDFQFETHSFQVGIGQVGIFFLQHSTTKNHFSEQNLTPIQDASFIPYRTNRQYFEAIDGESIYTNPSKEIYSQLEISTGVPYEFIKNTFFEDKIEEWLNDNLTFSTVTDNLIEFSFDNIVVNGSSNVDFDVYVKTNQQGLKFAASDVFVDYSHEAFGYSVVSNNNITGAKKQVIENSVYVLNLTDANSERLKIEVTSSLQPNHFYELSLYKEKFCHLSLNIQDIYELATMAFNESMMSDQSFFYDPSTGTYVPFDKIGVSNPILPFALPQIATLSPNPIPAGTGDILTITGSNFGNNNPQNCAGCRIRFNNGDAVNPDDAYAQYQDIVSWNDSVIQVKVPSATNVAGFQQPAASGEVWVERPSDLDPTIIEKSNGEDLHIPYAVFNYKTGVFPFSPIHRAALSQRGSGITFNFKNNVPSGLKDIFIDGVQAWCNRTQIAFKVDSLILAGNDSISGTDSTNLVIMRPASDFSNAARAAMVISGHWDGCGVSGGATAIFFDDIDIKIRDEFNPFDPFYEEWEWYNRLVHELGHAHMLNHSRNPSIPASEEYIVVANANDLGTGFHSIQPDDEVGAETVFSSSQTLLSITGCDSIMAITTHNCDNINSIYEPSIGINELILYPNPIEKNSLTLSIDLQKEFNLSFELVNTLGQSFYLQENQKGVNGSNQFQIILPSNLGKGVYFFKIEVGNNLITQKIIKQ